MYPLGLQVAVQGYGINMTSWKKLPPDQQGRLRVAIEKLTDDIWKYSEELWSDGLRCNAGQDPCTTGRKYSMKLVKVQPQDVELMKSALKDISLPAWSDLCEKSNPGCTATWQRVVAPVIGLK
jgi:hypothetical protein